MLQQLRWLEYTTDNREVTGSIPVWSTKRKRLRFKSEHGPCSLGWSRTLPQTSRCSSAGRTPDLGSGGRKFESCHLDQQNNATIVSIAHTKTSELCPTRGEQFSARIFRDMAQMVARFLGVEEATGSSPVISTSSSWNIQRCNIRHKQQIFFLRILSVRVRY